MTNSNKQIFKDMDPYLLIVKYLFKKNSINNDDESINSFFENGYSFPRFIAIIFQIDQIPETKKKPRSEYFKKINIDLALEYFYQRDPSIEQLKLNYQSENDRNKLLKLILTKYCFEIDIPSIINKSNMILKRINNPYHIASDIMNPTFLLTLLNTLTDNSFTDETKPESKIDFDTLSNSFQKADVPLVINKKSFNQENQDIFLIQVQIIFEIFSEKIKLLLLLLSTDETKKSSDKIILLTKINPTINIIDNESDEKDEESYKFYQNEDFNSIKNNYDGYITNNGFDSKELLPEEVREDEALLLTIGFLAEELQLCSRSEIKSFEFTLFNNFIPLFVMRYLNIETIPNLRRIQRPEGEESTLLCHREIVNIKIVIEYLKNKEKKFELLTFDFDSPFLFVNSAKTFFYNFLNTYFVRKSRIEMMERCHGLLGHLKWYRKDKLFTQRRFDTFVGLLSFIVDKKLKNSENSPYSYFSDFAALFNKSGVPRILSNEIIDEFYHDSDLPDSLFYQQSDKCLPNSIVFQLQFIFDKMDSLQSLKTAEQLILINQKIKNVKMPKFDIIKSIMRSKIRFLKSKNKIKKIDQNELNKLKELKEKNSFNEIKPKTFEQRNKDFHKDKIYNKNDVNDIQNQIIELKEDSTKFWNPIDSNFQIENCLLFTKSEPKELANNFLKKLNETEKIIKKKMNFKKDKTHRKITTKPETSPSITEEQQIQLNLRQASRGSSYNFQTNLYKLFYYDESKFQWIFDNDTFSIFSNDKKINVDGSRTPLIFYFNSDENDLVTINSNFLMGLYPQLDSNQLFVYAFCEKPLSKLNTTIDFTNEIKMIIKPIFLLLHVPKEKQNLPFIQTAISQIYIYLSFICDLSICVINENHIGHQIEFLQETVYVSNKSFKKLEKLKIILLKNNPNTEYGYNYDNQVHQLSNLKLTEEQSLYFYLANFENFDSYKPFIDKMIEFLIDSKTTFSIVKNYFKNFNLSSLSGMYISIYRSDSWKDELKKVIENRFLMLKSNDPNFNQNPEFVLIKLQKEFTTFAPEKNEEFKNECNSNFALMRKTFTKLNDNIIQEELSKSSKENLLVIEKVLSNKNYWTKNQLNNMINNHKMFLKKEFFIIVKNVSDEKLSPMIFRDNQEILNMQIKKDEELINEIIKPILDSLNNKDKTKEIKSENNSKKGTNYMLKETENVREIKIAVENIDKLESAIEQDF